mgnify:CR=1 FL=1
MSTPSDLTAEALEFLAERHLGTLTSLRRDGSPHVAAIGFLIGAVLSGATGFIGSALLDRLASDGHTVTGLGRNVTRARLKRPEAQWLAADLARMRDAGDWKPLIQSHDVIVNCAGALQDGLDDDVAATQETAMLALYAAAKAFPIRIVQISAPRGSAGSDSAFLATKFRADAALAASGVAHVILRPALVLGRNAHGGSALLRALAALPFVTPLVHAEARVETVALSDVAEAVSAAVAGLMPEGSDFVLGHGEQPNLADLVALHRQWLGLPGARTVTLPPALAAPVGLLADIAGRLGWRSPLRSTAMRVSLVFVSVALIRPEPVAMRPAMSESMASCPESASASALALPEKAVAPSRMRSTRAPAAWLR